MNEKLNVVNTAVVKKDAYAIMGGAPVYTEDLVPKNALTVVLKRSPHALARIKRIDTAAANKVPGVVCVLTYENVPRNRYSHAGASFPGNNPLDRVILDSYARYVGDPVAIIAAETKEAAERRAGWSRWSMRRLPQCLTLKKRKKRKIRYIPKRITNTSVTCTATLNTMC